MKENLPQRKKNRLKGYDYSSEGYYFITICIKNRENLLGKINVGAKILSWQYHSYWKPIL